MVKSFLRAAILFLALLLLTGCSARRIDWANTAAPAGTGFANKSFTHDGKKQNYTVFIPHNYSNNNKYPVIVFLHGVLEGGSDGKKCVTVGLGPTVSQRAKDFPFIVVFPQSTGDWQGQQRAALALATLDQVLKDYPAADADRVVLTGLSNGGDGTWSIGAHYTDRFAALVPMCGAPDYDDATRLTRIPIWAFHNSGDPFRSSGKAKEMAKRVKEAGGNIQYTQYSEFGHDCWTRAYSEGQIFTWIASQRRSATAASPSQALVKPAALTR